MIEKLSDQEIDDFLKDNSWAILDVMMDITLIPILLITYLMANISSYASLDLILIES